MAKTYWCKAGDKKGLLKKSLVFSFVCGIFAALQFVAVYIVLKALIENDTSNKVIFSSIVIMLVSIIGRIITTYFSTMEQTDTGYSMVAEKRIHVGDRLRYIPMGYFNKNSLGNIIAVVTTTLGDIENSASRVLVSVIGGFFNSVALIVAMLCFNFKIGLIAAVGVILYLIVTEISQNKSSELSGKRQSSQESLIESVLEYIQGMTVVKAFGMEKESSNSILTAIRENSKSNIKLTYKSVPYSAVQQFILRAFSTIMMFYSIYLYVNDSLSLGYSLIFIIISFVVFGDLENAGNMAALLQILGASIDTVNAIDSIPTMDTEGKDIKVNSTDIVFDNVEFSYEDRKILDKVNIKMPANTTTAIIGPSGSGKSTMCNLIARFWDIQGGKISIDGHDIKEFKLDSLMKNISMIFQNVYLFADTIENNIKFGRPNATHEEVVLAAKKACCHDFIMKLPEGYNTLVGEGGGTLSGGEKQRISIARAMLKDAPIIIFDEATSSVDPENEDELQKAMESLTHDKTIIMIAHRLKTVRNANQILVLKDGNIIQRGTHNELIKEKGVYATFISAREEAIGWKMSNN